MFFAPHLLLGSEVEEHRLPVGRPDFKSGETHEGVSGGFDSHLFRHIHLRRSEWFCVLF